MLGSSVIKLTPTSRVLSPNAVYIPLFFFLLLHNFLAGVLCGAVVQLLGFVYRSSFVAIGDVAVVSCVSLSHRVLPEMLNLNKSRSQSRPSRSYALGCLISMFQWGYVARASHSYMPMIPHL
ncbi:hypothetical protein QVD17_31612 [Tagetes erecta]|uniref:Uncharacterized protein n=1 Tax=Tagetes erecta TaxID=13708 RepID=A0AAD8K3R8_TARER|nr:hypothetical protein QVD17_31612 [Tagetes erecta]